MAFKALWQFVEVCLLSLSFLFLALKAGMAFKASRQLVGAFSPIK